MCYTGCLLRILHYPTQLYRISDARAPSSRAVLSHSKLRGTSANASADGGAAEVRT